MAGRGRHAQTPAIGLGALTILVTPFAAALVAKERCYDTPVWTFVCAALLPNAMLWSSPTPLGHAQFETMWALRFLGVSILFAAAVTLAPTRRLDAGLCGALVGALGAGAALWPWPEAPWSIEPELARLADSLLTLAALAWFTARTELQRWKKAGLWAAACATIGVNLVMQLS